MSRVFSVFRNFKQFRTFSRDCTKMEDILKSIFFASVDAVKPSQLITQNKFISLKRIENKEIIEINHKQTLHQVDVTGRKIRIVGFGKGVLTIAAELEKALADRIADGILSVPCDATKYQTLAKETKLHIYEGAAGNLPDNESLRAAEKIKDYVSKLNDNDILFCLITGGGSALLPLPAEPITLDEKSTLIRRLSRAGATINELNAVRIAISQVKGGKLARMAENAHKIISLIISDIINDPLELIASGPTIPYPRPRQASLPLAILEKYNLMGTLPRSIAQAIASQQKNEDNQDAVAMITKTNAEVFLIGNNRIALDAAIAKAKTCGLVPVLLSTAVQGDVSAVSEAFFDLAFAIKAFPSLSRDEFINLIGERRIVERLSAQTNFVADLIEALNQSPTTNGICIISGGETVVAVKCDDGLGGRNQELALRFTKLCHDNANSLPADDLLLLSAGSDGIDGNNDAAGAIGGTRLLASIANEHNVAAVLDDFINRNDSYRFYRNFVRRCAGDGYHILTGITGTNIMDIHLLAIMPKARSS